MTKNKYPPRKGPTKYRTPNSFRRRANRNNPALNVRKRIPITQHRA